MNLEKFIAFIPNVEFWCKDPTWPIILKTAAATGKSCAITAKKESYLSI